LMSLFPSSGYSSLRLNGNIFVTAVGGYYRRNRSSGPG
jgi:hypothetical protein